jgi:hypothetical protein
MNRVPLLKIIIGLSGSLIAQLSTNSGFPCAGGKIVTVQVTDHYCALIITKIS